jgi:hypothetical protein
MANDFVQYILNSVSLPTQNGNLRPSDIPLYVAQNNARFADFDHDAFASNRTGYKAFILKYASPGTGENDSSRGQATLYNPSHWLTVTNQYFDLMEGIDATAEEGQSTANQAIAQMLNINSPQMHVWIPSLDIDLEAPQIQPSPTVTTGYAAVNANLFRMCTIDREEYKTSPPPVGSLILVDFEDRAGQGGLAMTGLITQDRQFCRAVLSALSSDNNNESPIRDSAAARRAQTAELANNGLSVPAGDPLGWVGRRTPLMPREEIVQLAADYDSDTPNRVGNKSGHLAGEGNAKPLDQLHPDWQVYVKAFLRKVWDDNGTTIYITSTYRTHTEQQKLLDDWIANAHLPPKERGARPAPPGESYHNFAMAFDFNPAWEQGNYPSGAGLSDSKPFLQFSDDNSLWEASNLPAIGTALGLRWGGTFNSRDPIHFDFGDVVAETAKDQLVAMAQEQNVPLNRVDLTAVV